MSSSPAPSDRDAHVAASPSRRWWQFWLRSERIALPTTNEHEKQRAWLEGNRG